MTPLRSIPDLAHLPGPIFLAIGVFDGVHLGHQAVLRRALDDARLAGGTAVAVTFDPHPIRVLRPDQAPRLLTSTLHKLQLIRSLGLDHVLVIPFDRDFAATEPADFIRALADAGIPVGVNVAPVIPGLTDQEMPAILEAAAEAGADSANYVMLRLPYAVAPMFETWLGQHFPDRKEKVLNRLRDLHGGRLYDSTWGHRGRGAGAYAEQVEQVFRVARRRAGLDKEPDRPRLSASSFRVPGSVMQLGLL